MSQKIACITLDTEPDFLDPTGRIRLLEEEELFGRFVSTLKRRDVKLTAFLVTSVIPRHAEALRRLSGEVPVEFAVHSHFHSMERPCSREDIEQAVRAFQEFTGHAPAGYRAPLGQITWEGLEALMDLGFQYDSSIYPSLRPGKRGYNNLHLPAVPFRVVEGKRSIIEVPFACLSHIRLVLSLSYLKLFGWSTYALLMKVFPLIPQASILSHPHDYYFHLLQDEVSAAEKPLLLRNSRKAFDMLEKLVTYLAETGYQFKFMGELCDSLGGEPLKQVPMDRVVSRPSAALRTGG
jgi:peptidoglycan/xylan/chitin deacetylase (PgdA/CDA1 family)